MKPKGLKHTKNIAATASALCAICLCVLSPSLAMANTFGTNATLQAALDYGAENNQRIKAAYNQWQGALENIDVQKSLPDPMLVYGYYFDSVETRVGPQEQSIGISQKLPAFGKLAAMKAVAASMAQAYEQRYRLEKLKLDQAIAETYAELHYLNRNIAVTQDRIQLVRDLEEVARTRYKAGAPMAAVMQAQVELGRLEDRLNSLNDMLEPNTAKLNALLNRPADAPLALAASLPHASIDVDAGSLAERIVDTSPELMELEARIEQGDKQLKLARRNRWPDLTLGVQYIDTDEAAMPVADSGKDPVIGTIGITLPIWFGKNSSQIQAASHERAASELMLENRTQTLEAEIRQTLFKLRDAERKINLYSKSLVPKARQSLEINRQGYEAGKMEFINLIDAERMLLEFELAYERALADHLIARAELSKLTGTDFLSGESNEKR